MRQEADTHSLSDLFGEASTLFTGVVVLAPILPGFLLCIPGLILAGAVIAAPLLAVALLLLVAAAAAMPFVLVAVLVRRLSLRRVVEEAPARLAPALEPVTALEGAAVYAFDA
jgi:hypothetical protein